MKNLILALLLVAAPLTNLLAQTPQEDAKFLEELKKISAMSPTQPEYFKTILGNELSLRTTLDLIKKAGTSEDRFYLEYYIHANDEAGAMINSELLKAAERGATGTLVVDAITNLSNLDMFSMLTEKSQGRIKVLFYNVPTASFHNDLMFMTSPCAGSDCAERKIKMVERYKDLQKNSESLALGEGTILSRMILAGIGAKDADLVKFAIMQSGLLDGAGDEKLSKEKKQELMSLGELYYRGMVKGEVTALLMLEVVKLLKADELAPLVEKLTTYIPKGDWRDPQANLKILGLTDFTHKKLVVVVVKTKTGRALYIKTGGRNNENSYFLPEKYRHHVDRYLFTDIDVVMRITDDKAIDEYLKRLDDVMNFREMVTPLPDVKKFISTDFVKHKEKLFQAFMKAKARFVGLAPENIEQISEDTEKEFKILTEGEEKNRIEAEFQKMQENVTRFKDFKSNGSKEFYPVGGVRYNKKNDGPMLVGMLHNENMIQGLPHGTMWWKRTLQSLSYSIFGYKPFEESPIRVFGSVAGKEAEHGKSIHAAWRLGMERAAKLSLTQGPQPFYIGQGYVLADTGVIDTLGKLIRGEIPSKDLDIVIHSNALQTTDLAGINFLARHQIKALLDLHEYMKNSGQPGGVRSITIYENQLLPNGNKTSMHTKTTIFGDLVQVGTANLELRSLMLDANDAAYAMNASYAKKVFEKIKASILANPDTTKDVTAEYSEVPHSEFLKKDISLANSIFDGKKWARGLLRFVNKNPLMVRDRSLDIYLTTGLILDPYGAEYWMAQNTAYSRFKEEVSPSAAIAGGGGGARVCRALFEGESARIQVRRASLEFEQVQKRFQTLRSKGNQALKDAFNRLLSPL